MECPQQFLLTSCGCFVNCPQWCRVLADMLPAQCGQCGHWKRTIIWRYVLSGTQLCLSWRTTSVTEFNRQFFYIRSAVGWDLLFSSEISVARLLLSHWNVLVFIYPIKLSTTCDLTLSSLRIKLHKLIVLDYISNFLPTLIIFKVMYVNLKSNQMWCVYCSWKNLNFASQMNCIIQPSSITIQSTKLLTWHTFLTDFVLVTENWWN